MDAGQAKLARSGWMYTSGKSRQQLYALLFDKATRGSHKNPYEEKAYRGPGLTAGPDMVGEMQRVDGILQGSKCTWSS